MRSMTAMLLDIFLVVVGVLSPARAETVTMDEAVNVAQNWIALIIDKKGSWGGGETADVNEVREFRRGDRLLGYFCRVQPQGYVVISSRRDLVPVRAYSDTSQIDPELDEGMTDFIKIGMESTLDAIEGQADTGTNAAGRNAQNTAEADHRHLWELLGRTPGRHEVAIQSDVAAMNYEGGGPPLLSSEWRQGPPYNSQCPPPLPDPCCPDVTTSIVGCVPLAGAQVMRYWAWPPGFDWINMPDQLAVNSPAIQIDAVATICANVGIEMKAYYGQCGTSANFGDLLETMKSAFRYSENGKSERRSEYIDKLKEWFNLIKNELGQNRPVLYSVTGHTLVCDGWQEVGGLKQVHMNYGWGGNVNGNCTPCITNSNTWYWVEWLPCNDRHDEALHWGVYPDCAEGSSLIGNSSILPGVSVYFDQDASPSIFSFGSDPIVYATDCQFLPGVRVGSATESEIWASKKSVEFVPLLSRTTRLFSIKGTSAASVKVMENGVLKLSNGGKIRFF
jgi:hypothetical protein